jgi:hypothetical protein
LKTHMLALNFRIRGAYRRAVLRMKNPKLYNRI